MDGDFKGDFTRNTFSSQNHFSRVLMQQGRVQLDADWNEQVDILLYYQRTLIADLLGPRVAIDDGFEVTKSPPDQSAQNTQVAQATPQSSTRKGAKTQTSSPQASSSTSFTIKIGKGHYYIDGILVQNDADFFYTFDAKQRQSDRTFLVYVDVWERQVTYIENNSIREVALGAIGPDTATRALVVWQLKFAQTKPDGKTDLPYPFPPSDISALDHAWNTDWMSMLNQKYRGRLKAKSKEDAQQNTTPCIISPESRYRGNENQLYRVEIHNGGTAAEATFKWSRENGSVVFPIHKLAGNIITLDSLGHGKRFGLKPGDWVEIVDDDYYLQESPNPLVQVDTVDPINMQIILKDGPTTSIGQHSTKHPFLRRWDQTGEEQVNGGAVEMTDGAIKIIESTKDTIWITLEDNIQIQFQAGDQTVSSAKANYPAGDYWLIPARTVTGDVEWLQDEHDGPAAQDPQGVEHHFAPLALVSITSGNISQICDLRRKHIQFWTAPAGCTS